MKGVEPAYSRKPDPGEPWRYVCPECGRQVNGNSGIINGYRCADHGVFEKTELDDKANG